MGIIEDIKKDIGKATRSLGTAAYNAPGSDRSLPEEYRTLSRLLQAVPAQLDAFQSGDPAAKEKAEQGLREFCGFAMTQFEKTVIDRNWAAAVILAAKAAHSLQQYMDHQATPAFLGAVRESVKNLQKQIIPAARTSFNLGRDIETTHGSRTQKEPALVQSLSQMAAQLTEIVEHPDDAYRLLTEFSEAARHHEQAYKATITRLEDEGADRATVRAAKDAIRGPRAIARGLCAIMDQAAAQKPAPAQAAAAPPPASAPAPEEKKPGFFQRLLGR